MSNYYLTIIKFEKINVSKKKIKEIRSSLACMLCYSELFSFQLSDQNEFLIQKYPFFNKKETNLVNNQMI